MITRVALFVSLTAAASAHAATIEWSPAQDTVSASDVSQDGSSSSAFNGGQGTFTVGDATFVAANPFDFATSGGFLLTDTGDAEFNGLLNQASFSFNSGPSGTIDLGAFISGRTYQVQVFFVDQRDDLTDRVARYGSIDSLLTGSTVDLESDPNDMVSSPYGQFALGTFTADGDDPDLTVLGTNFDSAQINAWQVRDITTLIPEPSTAAITLLLGGAVVSIRSSTSSR